MKTIIDSKRFQSGLRNTIIAAALLYFLFCHAMTLHLGRADNGDFERSIATWIQKPYGFSSFLSNDPAERKDRFFSFYIPLWSISPKPVLPYYRHSVHLLWLPGWLLNHVCFSRDLVDLKYLGLFPRLLLFLILLHLAHWIRAGRQWAPLVLLLGLTLIFSDLHYTTFFNSFYQETGGLIYASLFIFFLVSLAWRDFRLYPCLALICLALLACAKTQYLPSSIFSAGLWLLMMLLRSAELPPAARRVHRFASFLAVAILALLVVAAYHFNEASSAEMRKVNAYHRLFKGLLVVSRAPESHLARLGFSADAQKYLGTEAFEDRVQDFYQHHEFNMAQALHVIAGEPLTLVRLIGRAAGQMNRIEITDCGIYQKGAYMGDRYLRGYRLWSIAKKHLFPRGQWLWFLYAAIFAGALCGMLPRRGDPIRLISFLALLSLLDCLIEMLVAVFGDGLAALDKHLFLANIFQDFAIVLFLCIIALWLAHALALRTERTLLEPHSTP